MLTKDELHALLHYDPDTGVFIWKENRRRARAGQQCTYVGSNGYISIKIKQEKFVAQKLAWLWMTGEFPPNGIDLDHINMVKTDNRFVNLRLATRSQNKGNTPLRPDNKSGFKGVSFHKASNKWRASICKDGRQYQLGVFMTPELAHQAYREAAEKLFGEFARPTSLDCPKEHADRFASFP